MSRKKKYSNEFRLYLVNEYLNGKNGGFKALASKYGLHPSSIQHWVHLYEIGGTEAFVAL